MPTVYSLVDPRTSAVRYVGRTRRPLRVRLGAHLSEARSAGASYAKVAWIRELLGLGLRPTIVELQSGHHVDARRENFWMLKLRTEGADLLNEIPAGDAQPRDAVAVSFRFPKAAWLRAVEAAAERGVSVNTYIIRAVRRQIRRDERQLARDGEGSTDRALPARSQ